MCAAAVDQPGHVALRVLQIEILRAVALHHIYHILPHIATLHPLSRHLSLTFLPHLTNTAFLCIISKIYFEGGHTTLWIPTAAIIPVLTLPAI